jgi:hypothetical protein
MLAHSSLAQAAAAEYDVLILSTLALVLQTASFHALHDATAADVQIS